MAAINNFDLDDDESLPLSKLREKLDKNKYREIEDDLPLSKLAKTLRDGQTDRDEIPLDTLSQTLREGQNNQGDKLTGIISGTKSQKVNAHIIDHTDYFRTIGPDDNNNESQNLENVQGIESKTKDVDLMKCDGIFEVPETNILDDDAVQEICDDSLNLDILRPLFDIPENASDGSFYMLLGNKIISEIAIDDSIATKGSENGNEVTINNTDTLQTTSEEEARSNGSHTAFESANEYEDTENETDSSMTGSEQEERTSRPRRRQKNEDKWKRNIRKRKRNSGEEYTSCKGKKMPRRNIQRPNCKCKFKCSEKISDEDQYRVFQNYWRNNYGGQRDFIRQNVTKEEKARKTTKGNSRRENTYCYSLPNECGRARVCKQFFLQTLCIGEKTVAYTLNKGEDVRSEDNRGRKPGNYKILDDDRQFIREHIRSFPTVDSHYCRKTTSRKYLGKDLSIRKMYELYKEKCQSEGRNPMKYWLYDKIFGSEFNIGFHHPKKDVCTFCDAYGKLSQEDKDSKKHEHEKHLERKQKAREQKANDKKRSFAEENIQVLNFDLQKVLVTPKLFVCDAYYSRKLATYNFTTYDLSTRKVNCYVWNESEAKRGSCEIATCLYNHNKNAGEKDEIIYYSDSCTGQQRNLPFCTMCLYSVTNLPIKIITHNYFERGHSQMEGDSVHAAIENSTRRLEMYSPSDWVQGIKNSKQTPPKYNVTEVKNNMILDFKECASSCISNKRKDINGESIQWNKIHSFQYKKSSPNTIYFKYDYGDEYRELNITQGRRKMTDLKDYRLKTLYKSRQSISALKYADLKNLCEKGLIPSKYHKFYQDLPCDSRNETLPEPHSSDDSDCESETS